MRVAQGLSVPPLRNVTVRVKRRWPLCLFWLPGILTPPLPLPHTVRTHVQCYTLCPGRKELMPIRAIKPRSTARRLPLTEARNTLGAVVKRVHLNKEYVILEKDGIPLAGVMDIDEFEDYLELQDPKVKRIIEEGRQQYLAGKNVPRGGRAHCRDLGRVQAAASGGEGGAMKIEYDPEADALYIQIREAHPHDNIDIEDGVTVDVDEHSHIVGVEILDARKRLSVSDLTSITIEKLPLEPTAR